jgi:hypothetical protein
VLGSRGLEVLVGPGASTAPRAVFATAHPQASSCRGAGRRPAWSFTSRVRQVTCVGQVGDLPVVIPNSPRPRSLRIGFRLAAQRSFPYMSLREPPSWQNGFGIAQAHEVQPACLFVGGGNWRVQRIAVVFLRRGGPVARE